MDDILGEASALLQCKECPWYKNCVTPMQLTAEDIRRQLKSVMEGAGFPQMQGYEMDRLLAGMASATQSLILEGCPIFIERLRTDPKLAQRLKEMMRSWGMEDTERKKLPGET